ncbi:hypothetical protein [Gemmata sp.]|uniref:hypothetical protein n=1 Tax=Gemmata sp. TaxID=1914242 RepID=UPI003F71AAC7
MLSSPPPGTRVRLRYNARARAATPHHDRVGTVVAPAGRARPAAVPAVLVFRPNRAGEKRPPNNHLVRLDNGELVVVPAGNLRRA